MYFIFLETIRAHDSLENQLWARSEFTEAKGFSQEQSFFTLLAVYALRSRRQAFKIISIQRQLCHCFPAQLYCFQKEQQGLGRLQANYYKIITRAGRLPQCSQCSCSPFVVHNPHTKQSASGLAGSMQINRTVSVLGFGKPHVQLPHQREWPSVSGSRHARAQDPEEE